MVNSTKTMHVLTCTISSIIFAVIVVITIVVYFIVMENISRAVCYNSGY